MLFSWPKNVQGCCHEEMIAACNGSTVGFATRAFVAIVDFKFAHGDVRAVYQQVERVDFVCSSGACARLARPRPCSHKMSASNADATLFCSLGGWSDPRVTFASPPATMSAAGYIILAVHRDLKHFVQ